MTRPLMPIDRYDDWETRLDRQDAFWQREIIDRAVVDFRYRQPDGDYPAPAEKSHDSWRAYWFDCEYRAAQTLHEIMNTEWGGDALPHAYPNLGPEVFSAYFGQELNYAKHTSWSVPCLTDWAHADALQFSRENLYWLKTLEYTDALLAVGEGKFYTGLTDLHFGGDAVASFRDPMNFCMDMLDHPAEARELLDRVTDVACEVLAIFFARLAAAGQPACTWAGPVSRKRWHVPSNDFSCMVSKETFDDLFLPGIRQECRHAEASLYHLDGPNALTHLDSLLEIPELDAIQWVFGEGHGCASDWIDVYKKIRSAGKGIQVMLHADELDTFISEFSPQGLWLRLSGVQNHSHSQHILSRINQWT